MAVERQVRSVIEPVMRAAAIPGMAVVVVENGRRHHFNFGVDAPLGRQAVTRIRCSNSAPCRRPSPRRLAPRPRPRGACRSPTRPSASSRARRTPARPRDASRSRDLHGRGPAPSVPRRRVGRGRHPAILPDLPARGRAGRRAALFQPLDRPFRRTGGRALGPDFAAAMTREILPGLGLASTFLAVPEREMARYAHGTAPAARRSACRPARSTARPTV